MSTNVGVKIVFKDGKERTMQVYHPGFDSCTCLNIEKSDRIEVLYGKADMESMKNEFRLESSSRQTTESTPSTKKERRCARIGKISKDGKVKFFFVPLDEDEDEDEDLKYLARPKSVVENFESL